MEKIEKQDKERKPYSAPNIVYEIELETRAGSLPAPVMEMYPGIQDPFGDAPGLKDPFDLNNEFDIYRP